MNALTEVSRKRRFHFCPPRPRHGRGRCERVLLSVLAAVALVGTTLGNAEAADALEKGFAQPPATTKPWCYWYWISDHISKEGITRDLEAMARVGIGEALVGNIFLDDVPAGKVKVLTPEWWSLVEHALREGGRTGVDIGLFNCPGWSQSGGPWIKPQQSMRYLVSAETRVTGPVHFHEKLSSPPGPFQDVAVLAFVAPDDDTNTLSGPGVRVTCTPAAGGVEKLADNDPGSAFEFPAGAGRGSTPFTVEWEATRPFTARSLQIIPAPDAFAASCELQVAAGDGSYSTVRRFRCDRSNMSPNVGFLPRGPVTISFPATTASKFRVRFTRFQGAAQARLAEVTLSAAARLEGFVEKQLGKMHPTPQPAWDTYLWPSPSEPEHSRFVVSTNAASRRDLTRRLDKDGTLDWDVPPGSWVIQRIGMSPTGVKNSPASPEGQGLEVDKMNRALAQQHFQAFIGEVLRRIPPSGRTAFKHVVADSYEMGSQNWTDGLEVQFQKRFGYDPKLWLPVLTGRVVASASQSERFLWDLRRLVADRVATDYVGGLRDACHRHGLRLWLENYGHWGFPSEFLKYGSESDRIGGEYWVTGDLGSIECRAASSCANTYGKPFVSAESFTGGPAFQNAPSALKARGDWAFCEGVNHFVLHVYIHQPAEDQVPGVNAWFGTEFNRHNTWFEDSRPWVDYLRRSCWLLQQGNRVADVAYFIGEDAPKMTGVRRPDLPAGRDFDYINAEVIEQSLRVKDGLLALPHGTTYRVLVLPEQDTMRPEFLRKLRDLIRAGATVVGRPPTRSPSLEHFPAADDQVRRLAAEVWGTANTAQPGERAYGKGRIVWGKSLEEVFAALGTPPDFVSSIPLRYTHRRQDATDIYFVANPRAEPLTAHVVFRAGTKAPEVWRAESGQREQPAVYDVHQGTVRMPLSLGPHGSAFVIFRAPAAPSTDRIVSVLHDGQEVLSAKPKADRPADRGDAAGRGDEGANHFAFAAWIKPGDDTTLVTETNRGVVGLQARRNDALAAPHGDAFGGSDHAGCGLAVGRNGVCVFEHGANYFAPTLVYAGPLPDWTHVTVVYRAGQPSLYLDGKPVRTGLKSEHTVHSGAGAGGLAQYRGRLGAFASITRALTDDEVAELARTMPRPNSTMDGPIELTRQAQRWQVRAGVPGAYEVVYADGARRAFSVAQARPPLTLAGSWEVVFAGSRAPERTTMDPLIDWTQHPVPEIRYFSGKATYRKTFEWSAASTTNGTRQVVLDLGEVRDLAKVRLNGQELGTLWMAPWRVEITGALRPGTNMLEVDVVNAWNNRLVGDQGLPPDQRRTTLLVSTVRKDAPLLPSGLIGPVTLHERIGLQLP